MDLSDEEREHIDEMPLYEMLKEWQGSPLGTFQIGDPRSDYFQQVMLAKREENPAGWTAASKALSWR